jgi:sugar phosphate isomerase/epimerase
VTDRRGFVVGLLASPWLAIRARAARPATSMYLAYTSFAVRMSQGRDILESNAAAVGPDAFRSLCLQFGAGGGQIDLSQVPAADQTALAAIRAAYEKDAIALEVSIPSRYLESPDAFAQAVAAARALGATRGRVALLSGRRYETFETASAWTAFSTKWRETLLRMRPEFERQQFAIGIENHKDWLAPELVALLRAIDSRYVGACVDFGNNLALLEHPDDTIEALAPLAVTTHLKDMAVRPMPDGFELSEVPLGQGILPLERYVRAIRSARPDAALCLEMITRDPLRVPFRNDRYWVAFDAAARDATRVQRFEQQILSRASARPLPRITGLAPAAQIALEDEHVRACVAYARDVLELGNA